MSEHTRPAPSLTRSTVIMSAATTVSRFTGYLRVLVLAYALGATHTTVFRGFEVRVADSYNLANYIPNMIFELVMGGILTSLFIPILIEYINKDKEESWYVASNMTNIALAFAGVVALVGMVFSYYFVRLNAVRVSPEAIGLAVFFFRIFAFQIIFYSLSTVFTGVLNAHRHFTMPVVAPIFNNLFVIGTILLLYLPFHESDPMLALTLLGLGTTVGIAVMAFIQVPAVLATGLKYRLIFDLRHPSVKKMLVLALPILGYVLSNQVGYLVINNLAIQFPGGVTAYQYSFQFFQLPHGILAVSIITALFPELAEQYTKRDTDGFKRTVSLGMRTTGLVAIPAATLLYILAEPIITVFLQYGQFDRAATSLTAPVLAFFALGLFFYSLYMMLVRTHYALQDTGTPLKINAVGVPLNIALNVLFVGFLGVKGLALGFTLTYAFTCCLLFYMLRRRLGPMDGRRIVVSLGKQLAAAIVMGLIVILLVAFLGEQESQLYQFFKLLVVGGAGVVAYLGLVLLLKCDEVAFIKKLGRRVLSFSR